MSTDFCGFLSKSNQIRTGKQGMQTHQKTSRHCSTPGLQSDSTGLHTEQTVTRLTAFKGIKTLSYPNKAIYCSIYLFHISALQVPTELSNQENNALKIFFLKQITQQEALFKILRSEGGTHAPPPATGKGGGRAGL